MAAVLTAMCSAFEPSSVMNHSAPCSTSAFAHSVWPLESATCRGAYPSRSRSFTSTSSSSSSEPASCAWRASRAAGETGVGSIVVRGEGFFFVEAERDSSSRPADSPRRSRNRKTGRRETYRVEVAVVALLGQELENHLDVADLRGVVQRAAFRGGGRGGSAGRAQGDLMSFARREQSTRRRWKTSDPGDTVRRGRIGKRAHSQGTDIVVVVAPEHRVETLEARRGSPRTECPGADVGGTFSRLGSLLGRRCMDSLLYGTLVSKSSVIK